MHRAIHTAVRADAPFVVGLVILRVPAIDGQIHSPDKRDRVVDAHDFLMVRAIDRMRAVEAQCDARMILPGRPEEERHRRAGSVDR